MYYVLGKEREGGKKNGNYHVYEITMERKRAAEAVESLMEFDKSTAPVGKPSNMAYKVLETDGNEFRKEFFQTFSIKYEQEEEEEEDYEGSALEIINTIGAGISPLKNLQDHLYFFIDDFLNEKDVDKKGGHYIASRLRAFLQTFDTLIDTVIDTLNDAIDLTEKRDGKV